MENQTNTSRFIAKKVGKGVAIAIFIAVAILVFGWVFMHLWNWLMPAIFGLTVINFKQAIGILIMSKILFGGLEGKSRKRKGHRWKSHMKAKWESMSWEEREHFKRQMEDKWCRERSTTTEPDRSESSVDA